MSRRLLLATLALVTTIAIARQADASEIRTVTPAADSYVSSASPGSNYGSATALRIDGSPALRSFLRFNVPALSAPVNKATLNVYVNRRVSAGITVRSVADTSWDEDAIKWSNAPAFGGAVGSSGSSLSAGWVSIDVTPLVSAGGPVSLALTTSSSNAIAVGSREYSTHAPQLVVETAATYSGEVMDDAPAGYWRMGEGVGSDAFDRTGAGQTGSYVGGTTLGVKGALGGDPDTAAGFDGAGGGVQIPAAAGGPLDTTTGSFAVEAWIDTTVNGEEAIASKQSDYARPAWQVTVTDDGGAEGLVRAKMDDGSAAIQAYGPQIRVDDGRWHHVVVDFDRASGITIYVDGSASRSTSGAVPGSLSSTAPLRIGQAASWYPTFGGQLDELAVYPALLSATRVKAHYQAGLGPDTTAPRPTLATPADGSSVADTTPTFSGTAGTTTGDGAPITVRIYAGSSTGATATAVATGTRDADGRWAADVSTKLATGTYTAQAEQRDAAGNIGRSGASTFTVTQPPTYPSTDPTILSAGDIAACWSSGDEATAAIVSGQSGTVLTLGDHAYDNDTAQEFNDCYQPSWGAFKSRTKPTVGDHEYNTPNASGYFGYFGAAAGDPAKGYYSYNLGAWHIVSLNSECDAVGGCEAGSPQETWLRQDLAASSARCTALLWHETRFSSGSVHGNDDAMADIWQAGQDGGADLVLAANDHDYERFAPQTADGLLDLAHGMSAFVVGTGGAMHYSFSGGTLKAGSEVRNDDTFGVLKLKLHSSSYEWEFMPQSGKTFKDYGSRACH